jgi:transcriptional regulator with XRE-family HTH domain
MTYKHLYQFLAAIRKKEDLTYENMAAKIGISLGYMQALVKGKMKNPSDAILNKIAHVWKIDKDYLLLMVGRVPRDICVKIRNYPELCTLIRNYSSSAEDK